MHLEKIKKLELFISENYDKKWGAKSLHKLSDRLEQV